METTVEMVILPDSFATGAAWYPIVTLFVWAGLILGAAITEYKGKSRPKDAFSLMPICAMIGFVLFMIIGTLGWAGTHTSAVEDAENASMDSLMVALEEDNNVTELQAFPSHIDLCYEDSSADMSPYAWTDADDEVVTGGIKKSAERNGVCSYTLFTGTGAVN